MSVQFKEQLVDAAHSDDDRSSVDSQESSRQINKFQLLDLVDEDQELTSNIDDGDNGGQPENSDDDVGKPSQTTTSSSSKQKKRRRRNKGKANKINQSERSSDLSDCEFIPKGETKNSNQDDSSHQTNTESLYQFLKLDMRNLIPENELKRMFGKSIVKDEQKQRHHPGIGSGNQRSRFMSASHSESRLLRLSAGPKMEIDDLINQQQTISSSIQKNNNADKKNKTGKIDQSRENHLRPTYFRFVHDKSYQLAHSIFLDAAYRGDSETIFRNAEGYPHVESLIQLSDMYRISEDYKVASGLIEQALLILESGFHQRFNFAQANCRLSYKRPENRSLFITIFKHVVYCNRRGLRRTPLEYTKFLLSLDPENDPLFASLMIDFYAIRSEEYDYLINFISKWKHLSKLPNMKFSLALAYFMKSRCMKSGKTVSEEILKRADDYLQDALLRYPNFIIPLLDECSAEPDSGLRQCDYFDYSVYSNKYKTVPEAVDLLVNLYAQRSSILWKTKQVSAWLERNVATMVSKFANKELVDQGQQLDYWSNFRGPSPRSLLRHIILSDLKIKIPSSAASSTILDIDPFPPESIVSYQPSSNPPDASLDPNQSQPMGISSLFIRSMLPNFSSITDSSRSSGNNLNRDDARPGLSNLTTNDQELEEEITSINQNIIHGHVQNVLATLGNLLAQTDRRPPDSNDGRQQDDNQEQ